MAAAQTADFTLQDTACAGLPIDVIDKSTGTTGTTTYTWTFCTGATECSFTSPSGSTSPSPTPPQINYSQPGTYHVTLVLDQGLPTASTLTKMVVVLPVPSFSLGKDTTLCQGDSLILRYTGTPEPYNSLLWSDGSARDTLAVYTPGDYNLRVTNVACIVNKDIIVSFTGLAAVATIPDTAICRGSTITLATTVGGADSVRWTPAAGLSNSSVNSPFATPLVNTSYIITAYRQHCPARDTVAVTLIPFPVISVTPDTLICPGASVPLMASGADTYTWLPAAGLTDPNSNAPVASPAASTKYYVIGTTLSCSSYDSVLVSIKSLDKFQITPPFPQVCIGGSIVLQASGADPSRGDTYTWLPGVGMQDPHASRLTVSPDVPAVFQLAGYDKYCDQNDTVSVLVTLRQPPVITLSKSNDIDCIYGETTLSASGGVSYTWFPTQGLSNPFSANPVARTDSSTLYYVQVTDAPGCTNTDSIAVFVSKGGGSSKFSVANAFTPNGDGLNDCFGIKYWGALEDFDMTIFDRWGQLVFHGRNPGDCWDGRFQGKIQPTGTYVYIIKARSICGDGVRKGTVLLIR